MYKLEYSQIVRRKIRNRDNIQRNNGLLERVGISWEKFFIYLSLEIEQGLDKCIYNHAFSIYSASVCGHRR